MEFHTWLREEMRRQGISYGELAHRTGYSPKTIEAYIYGNRTPSRQGVVLIARELGLPAGELLERIGLEPLPHESTACDRPTLRYTRATALTQFTIVPVIGSVSIEGRRITSEVDEVLSVRAQDLENIVRPVIVVMPDGSMAGRGIEPGDHLLVEQIDGNGIRPRDGEIAVVYATTGEKRVREWWSNGEGAILRAAASGVEPLSITGDQFEDMDTVVIGIVKKVLRVWDV